MKKLFLLIALAAGAYFYWQPPRPPNTPFGAPPGAHLATEPAQSWSLRMPVHFLSYTIVTLASYEVDARVLGIRSYPGAEAADLVPLDLALGWGPMADPAILSQISVSQSDHKFYWSADHQLPLPAAEVSCHSANNHIIPASPEVRTAISAFQPGELISLRGRLVSVSGPGSWNWSSSLTRDDTGDGACELFYVESATRIDPSPPAPSVQHSASVPTPSVVASSSRPSPPRPLATAPAARRIVLSAPLTVRLPYGSLVIPAGESLTISAERSSQLHATYRAHDFWIEKSALPSTQPR